MNILEQIQEVHEQALKIVEEKPVPPMQKQEFRNKTAQFENMEATFATMKSVARDENSIAALDTQIQAMREKRLTFEKEFVERFR